MGFETSDLISSFEASFSSFLSGNGFGTALSISNWLSLRLAVPEVLSFSILTSVAISRQTASSPIGILQSLQ
uniref:Uncharacterized protein MANES_09G088900 n=1 Tax=Rhizophora mucronata TaxID=61149 RepID=A0A2P2MEE2_RHIMU